MIEKQLMDFDYNEQMGIIDLLKLFRKKAMCQYAILMETLIFRYFNWGNKEIIIQELEKTANNFINNTYLAKKKTNPESWDDFFKVLGIPLSIDAIKAYNLREYNGFFIMDINIKYSYQVDDRISVQSELVHYLLKLGYNKLGISDTENPNSKKNSGIRVGYETRISFPFTFEEQFFFLGKYFMFYNLFTMWRHICDFYRTIYHDIDDMIWLLRDRKIADTFYDVIDDFFNVESVNFPRDFFWKYDFSTLDRDLVNVLFNKFLFSRMKKIEKKLSLYTFNRVMNSKNNKAKI